MKLLERDALVAQLQALLEGARAGPGRLALVAGEAGIGKTVLLRHFAEAQKMVPVLWGACDALQTPRPLSPLHDIAVHARGPLPGLLAADAERTAIFSAFIDLLKQPALVVFEDLHWADEATLDLLRFVGRRIARTQSLLVASFRDDELGPLHPLRQVLGDLATTGMQRFAPLPLSLDAVRDLAGSLPIDAHALHRGTGGNPFFVTEVLAAGGTGIPPTVRDAVWSRAARLRPSARAVLDAAAVAGPRIEPWLLDDLAAAENTSIDECLSSGVLRVEGGVFMFRHELGRQAVLELLTPTRAASLHRMVLKALQARPAAAADLTRLVHHAAQAHDAEAVQRHAPAAAQRAAQQGAHREAAAHYATALAWANGLDPARHAELLDGHAYECYLVGDVAAAVAGRNAALAQWRLLGRRDKEGDALRALSRLHWYLGHHADSQSFGVAAVQTLEPLGPSAALAMAYSNLAQFHMLASDNDAAIQLGEKAIALARRIGSPDIESHALNNVGSARLDGTSDAGLAELEQSLALALAGDFQEHIARAYTNLGTGAVTARAYPLARRALDAGLAYCEERDIDAWGLYMRAWQARARFEQCEWQSALRDAHAVLESRALIPSNRIPALVVIARIRLRQGESGAEDLLDEARDLALKTNEPQRICPVAAALAERAWLEGDRPAAVRAAQWGLECTRPMKNPWPRSELSFWLWVSGGMLDAVEHLAAPFARMIAGEGELAAAAWEQLGCPYEQALALAQTDTEENLRAALALFQNLGARPMATRVLGRLRARGARRLPRGPRASTRDNPAGLTAKEVKVLALLALGLRSKEIGTRLSRSTRTVDHHLASIFSKLNVASRADAVTAAHRLGMVEPARRDRTRS